MVQYHYKFILVYESPGDTVNMTLEPINIEGKFE